MAKTSAKSKRKVVRTTKQKAKSVDWQFPLHKKNFMVIGIGIGVILLGYALMATGISDEPATVDGTWNNPLAVTVAPILLIIGYCVIIPYAILKYFGRQDEAEQS